VASGRFEEAAVRILFYGAGVLGSLYAARLREAGHDVSILARGRRLVDLREHGAVLEDANSWQRTSARVEVVEHLAPQDSYELVVVCVRKNQLPSVLPALAESRCTPNVLFMHNNVLGPSEIVDALGRERVLLGFPGAGGGRDGPVIRYHVLPAWQQKTVLGELDGRATPRLERIVAVFRDGGFPVGASPNMEAWLKTHASWVVPVSTAVYAAGGDVRRLAHTRDALLLMVRGIRENFEVLRAHGVPLTPKSPNLLVLGWLPEPLLVPLLRRLFDTRTAEIVMERHANAARDETGQLADELGELSRAAFVPTPTADRLREYLDPAVPPIPEGSARMAMDLGGAWLALSAAMGALVVLRLLRRRGRAMRPSIVRTGGRNEGRRRRTYGGPP
jgi:2-dehydropantoate 2-reductase